MSKTHEIEKCMRCGVLIRTLMPSNNDGLCEIRDDIDEFIRNPPKAGNLCLSVITSLGMSHYKSDITYYLCANCCMDIVAHIMRLAVAEDRKIMSRNFDDLRLELKT